MESQQVVLVDSQDQPTGKMEKLEAHRKGVLHRAFSVFIFNKEDEMLLQQRAKDKYHSAGLWTNACCSHPRPDENVKDAAERRLMEEMGFTIPLEKIFDFIYKEEVGSGLIEYEFDHVFTGSYDGEILFNEDEVVAYAFKTIAEIEQLLKSKPALFSKWFHIAFPRIVEWRKE